MTFAFLFHLDQHPQSKILIMCSVLYLPFALSSFLLSSTFHARAIKAAPYDCEICFNYALHMEDSKEDAKRNFDFAR